nr:ATPase, F1/V1/A1 complex, alpha/beta subunit, zinc knuckle CX2CX4HX4C [Tanacetum cinerariifolium]
MESDNDKEDRVEIKEVNVNDGFDEDLCGDQFPPIINQVVNNENDGVQDCLDQDLEYNGKGEDDDIKSKDVSEGSTRKPVGEKSNGYNGNMGGGLNMKFAKIVNANKIDNKLVEISTEISEKGNKRDEKGMEEVVSNGPWLVNNKPLCVQKWRVGMALEKAEPSKLPIWVKMINVPMEVWSLKCISTLASSIGKPIIMDDMIAKICAKGEGRMSFARVLVEVEVGKDLKKEIEVMYKGNLQHERFTKKIQVEYAWKPPSCEKFKVFGHDHKNCGFKEKKVQGKNKENTLNNTLNNADMPFIVVLNKRVNYEKWKDNRNNNSWNGYNWTYNRQRYYGTEYKFYSGRENNGKWNYRKKQDDAMGNPSGENNSGGYNRGENNKKNEVNVDKTKGNSTMMNSSEKDNLEKVSNKNNEREASTYKASTYNRFTLLNDLVGEDELVPPIEKRKIIDEYMSRENELSEIDSHGWSKKMKKYYKDKKELFDATKDLEKEDNVEQRNQFKEELNIRNELGGEDGDVFV